MDAVEIFALNATFGVSVMTKAFIGTYGVVFSSAITMGAYGVAVSVTFTGVFRTTVFSIFLIGTLLMGL